GAVVTIGALMSFSTCLNATLLVPARILYVFGEDRMLPQWIAGVSSRFHTPWISLVINTAIALILLWTKSFKYVLDVVLVAMFLYYALHSASLVALPFIRPGLYKKAGVRLRPVFIVICGLVSIASMGYLAVTTITGDIKNRELLAPAERGLAIWQLLIGWI